MQLDVVDWETGEILDQEKYDKVFSDNFYEEELYITKWWDISQTIAMAEKNVKFWHKVDKKFNRSLCNQTIRGTRTINDKIYKINKIDVRTKDGYKTFKTKIEKGNANDFLMATHDPKTFESLLQIMKEYGDADNPFVAYENETGDYIRKYSKKGNGPRIGSIKYKDGQVGSCIDISSKYGHAENSRKVILESLKPYRMDVYYNKDKDAFYMIGLKYSDCKFKDGKYIIDEDAYDRILRDEKMIKPGEIRKDLENKEFEFRLTFYENEIIRYEKAGEYFTERFLSRTKKDRNCIETKPIQKARFDKQNIIKLGKTKSVKKIRTDILGNQYICEKENFSLVIDN